MLKRVVFVFFLITLTSAMPSYSIPPAPWEIEELDNAPAPDFKLKSVDGQEVSLSSLKGKVVLLNFWATWCDPCRDEMPSLNKLYKEFKDKNFVVLGISSENARDVKAFLNSNPLEFLMLIAPNSSVSKSYKVFMMPTSFLIDKKGRIVNKYLGQRQWLDRQIKEEITKAINSSD
ncbi:redoxin domain-containing protein [Candidatus Magnetoovum chiemensis]|nr:redoxin domain-containing protein [Candidatus Magnetoovum chiemensis]